MDIKKLQKIVVDALEDVKAQDIRIFDTTHLTSMFDRVAIASGTSNRQTKALAASVRDKVKQAGGTIVSMEGENTGEWVLVDLGDMVVHIMQPTIRAYYQLEEIWGDKPVSLKEPKRTPTKKAAPVATGKAEAKTPKKSALGKTASKTAAKSTKAKKAPAKKVTASKTATKTVAAKKAAPTKKVAAKKTAAKQAAPRKTAATKTVKTTKNATTKTAAKKTSATKKTAK